MNSACLIGLVACLPRPVGDGGDVGFLLLTAARPARPAGSTATGSSSLRVHSPDLADFSPGATVYVEGHLARHGDSHRVSVIAHRAWSIAPAPSPPEEERADRHPRLPAGAPAGRARQVVARGTPARAPHLGAADHCPSAIGAHRTDLTTREALTWWPTLSVPHSTTSLPGSATFGRSRGGPVASVLGWRGSAGWTPTLQCA